MLSFLLYLESIAVIFEGWIFTVITRSSYPFVAGVFVAVPLFALSEHIRTLELRELDEAE